MEVCKTGDLQIAYRVKGQGEDVLLLHGFPDSSTLWDRQVPELAKTYRVIVPDLLGFGESSKPKDVGAYKIQKIAQTVFNLLDSLNASRVRVAGHDWGALLTWTLLGMQPERFVKASVLACGHPMGFFPAGGLKQRQLSWYMLFFQQPQAEQLLQVNDWALWKRMMGDSDEKLVQHQISLMSKEGALTAGLNWYRANFSVEQFAMTTVPKVPKLKLPVLGIFSTEDKFLTEEQMTASVNFIEEGLFTYQRIEGAGHWMQKDAPEVVSNALLNFFGQ